MAISVVALLLASCTPQISPVPTIQASPSTVRISLATGGGQPGGSSWTPEISADGRHVVFESEASDLVPGDTNGVPDIFLHDIATGLTERVSVTGEGTQGDGRSFQPSVSGDGRFVAFASLASNLVPGDTNGFADVFLHDRQTGTTNRLSVAPDGSQAQCSS